MRDAVAISRPGRWARANAPVLAGLVLLVVLYAGAGARYHDQHFLTVRTFLNLLGGQPMLGLVAVGMTFVIISGGIDLSVGAVMGLSSIVIAKLTMGAGWPAWLAIAMALAIGAAFGAAQGLIIQGTGLGAFIVTLAGMFMARGIGFLIIQAYSLFDMPRMYAMLIVLFVLAIGVNALVGRLGGLHAIRRS